MKEFQNRNLSTALQFQRYLKDVKIFRWYFNSIEIRNIVLDYRIEVCNIVIDYRIEVCNIVLDYRIEMCNIVLDYRIEICNIVLDYRIEKLHRNMPCIIEKCI